MGTDDVTRHGRTSRRKLLVGGAAAAVGVGALSGSATAAGTRRAVAEDALFDKIVKSGKVRMGIDPTFKPLQYKDPATNEPTGFNIEVSKLLAKELGAEVTWVEVPFSETFAALAAGRFDISGITAINTPARALRVTFASAPSMLEPAYIFQKKGLNLKRNELANNGKYTIAAVTGTVQALGAKLFFPKAKLKEFPNDPAALADVSTGRSDFVFLGDYAVAEAAGKGLRIVSSTPVFNAWDTYYVPHGNPTLAAFITTFLQNKAYDLTLASLWEKFVAKDLRKFGLTSPPVRDPWLS
ncbi:MAG: amino acid ABC transporter substrate-binding protein [Actinobacteria bacterium]|nr:amino acid ABC transporter substrate-binding protein [Actinomycetota bacterium]